MLAQLVKNFPAVQETWVQSLGWEGPWRRKCNQFQYSCLENSMNKEVQQATDQGVPKSQTQLSN